MKIYIGADHRGFELKDKIRNFILEKNLDAEDLGAFEVMEDDDFVEYAQDVAEHVVGDSNSRGIVICGSGAGVEIAANKIDGVRCTLGQSEEQIKKAREDDNVNVLAIASDFIDFGKAQTLIEAFLNTDFIQSERHERRIREIKNLE